MKHYFAIALAVLAVAACQKNEGTDPQIPGKVRIEPVITKATEVNFEEGDKIGLTVVAEGTAENYATNECLTFASDVFTSSLDWYADVYTKSNLYAYYPYNEAGAPTAYAQVTDQSEGIGAADFMLAAKSGVLPTSNAVTMVFKHMGTKLVINVDNETGSDVEKLEIMTVEHVAGVDYENAALTSSSDGAVSTEMPVTIAYEAVEGKTWNAIVIPQTGAFSIIVTLSNKTVITQSLASATYKSGGQYTINARILPDNMIVSATGEIQNWTDEGEVGFEGESSAEDLPVTFTEYDGYFEYDGVEYKTVTLADGNTWMAENLRFIPRGRTVSSDPAEDAGIWYPAANAEKTADPSLVETLGLLYDSATAFGTDEITAENAASFEGCQGICPAGWHIPTVTEMTGLVGHCSNSAVINTEAPYYDATIKGASIAALTEAGWPWTFASCRNKTNITATGAYLSTTYNGIYGVMSYIIGSSLYQVKTDSTTGEMTNIQFYNMMPLYNASNEKISVAYGNFLSGSSVRCIKDKAAE
ncbi:MAG: fimbrillin family protein [Bacteroidales bacterium]|nr:fimbrillin family protein [Bacteroidales bacterium]